MAETRKITIELDDLDEAAVNYAIAFHQSRFRINGVHILPDGESDTRGAILAEICRGYLERLGEWPPDTMKKGK